MNYLPLLAFMFGLLAVQAAMTWRLDKLTKELTKLNKYFVDNQQNEPLDDVKRLD